MLEYRSDLRHFLWFLSLKPTPNIYYVDFMNAVEIEQAVSELAELPFDAVEFPCAFLTAFGNKAFSELYGAVGKAV